jgi:dTDP-3-amino-3,4,6-trideoxy-alpha-D-glucose transaminase
MTSSQILNHDFVAQWRDLEKDVLSTCQRVGLSGSYVLGQEVISLERSLAQSCDVDYCIGTGNGMDALEIALRAAGLQDGDLVLTTPLSAFASTLAILRAGGIPVYVDTDSCGLLDFDLVEELLTQKPEIKWMLPVHLFGHCLDLERMTRLKDHFGLKIVEDCAQSIGARFRGKHCGTVGIASGTSFYPTKNLGALGDGGAILTNNLAIDSACRAWRNYGQSTKYVHALPGLNSRLDELQAAILVSVMLPRLSSQTKRRQQIAARYREKMTSPFIHSLPQAPGSESVYHLYPVLAGNFRAEFMSHLKCQGIQSAIHYPCLIPDQTALSSTPFQLGSTLSRAKKIADEEVSLPIHPYLSDESVEQVIHAVNQWVPKS